MSRILLTGASGFLGRHCLAALAASGHEVHAVARRRGPALEGVQWHEIDVLEQPDRARALEAQTLVHLAWFVEHDRHWSAPDNVRWVEASLALLRAFVAGGGVRAIVAGSCAEYEWSRAIYREDARLKPATLYGAAKHGLHVVAGAYAEQRGLELAWARLFFLYGPAQSPGRFVPAILQALLAGEPAPMTAGTQRRDFMHVADAGAAFAMLADSSLTGAVNVASGEAIELRELARLIAARAGGGELLRVGALPTREGDPTSLVADVGRLRDELGFRPRMPLVPGLEETISWWRARMGAAGKRHDA